MNALKSLLLTYLNSGAKKSNSDEINRRVLVIHLFALIGTSITGIAGFIALANQNIQLSSILFVVCFIFTLGPITQRVTNNYRLSSGVILYQLYILMFFLLYSGGPTILGLYGYS